MTYYLYVKGERGCDHGVGCGERLFPLKWDGFHSVILYKEVLAIMLDHGIGIKKHELSECRILSCYPSCHDLGQKLYAEMLARVEKEAFAAKETKPGSDKIGQAQAGP